MQTKCLYSYNPECDLRMPHYLHIDQLLTTLPNETESHLTAIVVCEEGLTWSADSDVLECTYGIGRWNVSGHRCQEGI